MKNKKAWFSTEMVNHVKNGQIKIKIKINLFESLMIKIKLHFD